MLFAALPLCFLLICSGIKPKKPEALFAGKRKGTVDKLSFIGTRQLELKNNADSLWSITGYEFNFNCGGKVFMRYYYTHKIEKEITDMVKDCKAASAIADFINIKAKNSKTGLEVKLNNIELTISE